MTLPSPRPAAAAAAPGADAFVVTGGRRLAGTVTVSGAKNSALKLFAAALLAPGRSVLHNVPDIADVTAMTAVVRHLGVDVAREAHAIERGRRADAVTLEVPERLGTHTPADLVARLRASIVVLGPLLARTGHAHVAQPGGCNLGNRSIELHLKGLEAMGADIHVGVEHVEAHAPGGLVGTDFELDYASVGATENLVMAAVLARGTTRLRNVAREPEIGDLVDFLTALGAQIDGRGTGELEIVGVDGLAPATHRVLGDRIEAGTFAVAAAVTGGDVTIEGVDPEHLARPIERLEAAGVTVRCGEDHLRVLPQAELHAIDIATLPYPGFPTDLQPQFIVLLSQAAGTSMITENVFDGRFSILGELRRLGVDAHLEGHHIVVRGPRRLLGDVVTATDLRAGAALVLAGLVAEGDTIVLEPRHVDRGYTDFVGKLRGIGAQVTRRITTTAAAG